MNNFAEKPNLYPSLELLMKVFDFTEEDLLANQEGYPTPSQISKIRRSRRNMGMGISFMLTILTLIGLGASAWVVNQEIILIAQILAPILCFALPLFLMLYSYYELFQEFYAKKKNFELNHVCGMVILDNAFGTTVEIGDKKFSLTPKQFLAIQNGASYCFHFYDRDSVTLLLSVEPV